MKKLSKIWINGKFVNWNTATTHILNQGLHYGSGVFEGIRFYKTKTTPAVFRLDVHMERLLKSAKAMKIKIPYSKTQLINTTKKLIKINKAKEGYIRPIAFQSYGAMGLDTRKTPITTSIAAWPWGAYLGEEGIKNGIKVLISSYKRTGQNEGIYNVKICGNYIVSILAKREAIDKGFQEAIMFDDKGYLAEGAGENIFIVKNNKLITPTLESALPGITRDSIIRIAKDKKIPIKITSISKKQLLSADEVFFCGTAAEVTPIKQINKTRIGKPGSITQELQDTFFKIVKGENKKYNKWLFYV